MNEQHKDSQTRQADETGSFTSDESVFLAVGKLLRPHGLRGEIKMKVITDFPERLCAGASLYVGPEYEMLTISDIRGSDQSRILSFTGLEDREEVGRLRNMYLYIRTDTLHGLPEGEYYFHELLGLVVVDEGEQLLGTLEEIMETGANDVYIVRTPEGEEILLPAIESVILEVDLEKRQILVRQPAYW